MIASCLPKMPSALEYKPLFQTPLFRSECTRGDMTVDREQEAHGQLGNCDRVLSRHVGDVDPERSLPTCRRCRCRRRRARRDRDWHRGQRVSIDSVDRTTRTSIGSLGETTGEGVLGEVGLHEHLVAGIDQRL